MFAKLQKYSPKMEQRQKQCQEVFKRRELYATTSVWGFSKPKHTGFMQDVCVTLIDKTRPFIPTTRKDYWRQILKTCFYVVLTSEKVYSFSKIPVRYKVS